MVLYCYSDWSSVLVCSLARKPPSHWCCLHCSTTCAVKLCLPKRGSVISIRGIELPLRASVCREMQLGYRKEFQSHSEAKPSSSFIREREAGAQPAGIRTVMAQAELCYFSVSVPFSFETVSRCVARFGWAQTSKSSCASLRSIRDDSVHSHTGGISNITVRSKGDFTVTE